MNENNNNQNPQDDFWKRIVNDPAIRMETARNNHLLFFQIYFPHYVIYATAPFHKELFGMTHNVSIKTVVIEAFRGSGKSTIMSLSYPLWAILGCQKKKFIMLVAQTQEQARQYLSNIKMELETNTLLRNDMGPFTEDEEWRSSAIMIPKYNARIMVVSIDTAIRGFRYAQYRPDLIICDDLEDMASAKTRDGRDKIYSWFTGDIMSLGDKNTRVVIIGTPLHEDSLIPRLKKQIESGFMHGAIKSYPLVNDAGDIAWPGKYLTLADVDEAKRRIGNEPAWQREYMLRIVADEYQIIRPEWIKNNEYEIMPSFESPDYTQTYIGIDPAVSQEETANNTAMVVASVFGHGDKKKIYIHPHPVNKRMTFHEMQERAIYLAKTIGDGRKITVVVEDVAAQRWLHDELKRRGIKTELFKVHGMKKYERLQITTVPMEVGQILFPKYGKEDLEIQLVEFFVERYDDLADAFSLVIGKIIAMETAEPGIIGFMRNEHKEFMKNPNFPRNMNDWKRWTDRDGFQL